jgi:twitching motility protein PilT
MDDGSLANKGLDIHRLLQTMVDKRASDLHVTVGSPPCLRIDGRIFPLRTKALTGSEIASLAYSVMSERQQKLFEETNELDLSFQWKGTARFRANFFRQQGAVAGVFRQIPNEIPGLAELGVPSAVSELVDRHDGLILVTGPTGSGKSTTLASFVASYNAQHRGHIITVEDPIEFMHVHKKCIVNQRELGSDTDSYASALRFVLRQDPDAVLIGEVRDTETMEAVLRISETGHLAFSTLHTNNAVQSIHRILDLFAAGQQDMVRTQLSFVLQAIISQQLVPRADGKGRVLACEVLIPNNAIRNLIRENKTHQIYSLMQVGQNVTGMQTLNQSLFRLVSQGVVEPDEALARAYEPTELKSMFKDAGITERRMRRRIGSES